MQLIVFGSVGIVDHGVAVEIANAAQKTISNWAAVSLVLCRSNTTHLESTAEILLHKLQVSLIIIVCSRQCVGGIHGIDFIEENGWGPESQQEPSRSSRRQHSLFTCPSSSAAT